MQKTPYKNPKKILAQIWRTLKRKISVTCCFTTRYADFGGERGSNIFVTKRSQLYSFISSWLRFLYIREYHLKPIVPNIKAENGYFFGYAIFHPRHKN